jgi:DNA-binding response OmpR family regulator
LTSGLPPRPPVDIVIVGLPQGRANLLRLALESALKESQSRRRTFSVLECALADLDPDQFADAIVLAGDKAPRESDSLFRTAKRLRSCHFLWCPLHLLESNPIEYLDSEREWAIYSHRIPVEDVDALATSLLEEPPLRLRRRMEIVRSALVRLGEELGSLSRSLDTTKAIGQEEIRRTAAGLRAELLATKTSESYSALDAEIKRLEGLPTIREADLNLLYPIVRSAEAQAKSSKQPDALRVVLHRLVGDLALAKWRPEAPHRAANRISALLVGLQARGFAVLPQEACVRLLAWSGDLASLMQSVLDGRDFNETRERLSELIADLYSLMRTSGLSQTLEGDGEPPDRIVVVEDHSGWRRQIVKTLESMLVVDPARIQEARSVEEARWLLKDQPAALVLVDMGLPIRDGSEVVLDAGLSIIKEFSGTDSQGNRFRHRFVVLTAAESYAEAVRAALDLGVSPWSYLQKKPDRWEEELRAQVRLAVNRSQESLPTVEVFKRTGRIARIEGMEISLDRPQWCLLAVLAEGRKWGWTPESLANDIYYQYSLVPESRSSETALLDPADRIRLQIPHYVSELRKWLTQAFMQARHRPPATDLITFDEESGKYRLNARARLLDRVDEHFRTAYRPTVLVVEDDLNWGREILEDLKRRGFKPRWARWTEEAWRMIEDGPPDLLSLDLELPATERQWSNREACADRAVDLLRRSRAYYPGIPVAVLTAIPWQDSVMLEMMRQGVRADDYLSKLQPEPIARLAASLGRLYQESLTRTCILDWDPTIPLHRIEIDRESGMLTSVDNHPIKPSGKGKELLRTLSATPNVFVSRTELIEAIYGSEGDGDDGDDEKSHDQGLNHLVKRLRATIKDATDRAVPGDEVICGDHGVYWLRGIVQ